MASLNTGKAIAQGSHASTMFVESAIQESDLVAEYNEWSGERGFGTTITKDLGPYSSDMTTYIQGLAKLMEDRGVKVLWDVVHDPDYPLVDGSFVHHIPLDTCGWVFAPKELMDQYCNLSLLK